MYIDINKIQNKFSIKSFSNHIQCYAIRWEQFLGRSRLEELYDGI